MRDDCPFKNNFYERNAAARRSIASVPQVFIELQQNRYNILLLKYFKRKQSITESLKDSIDYKNGQKVIHFLGNHTSFDFDDKVSKEMKKLQRQIYDDCERAMK